MISLKDFNGSGASEYEIYFNFMNIYHNDKIKIRELYWKNESDLNKSDDRMDYVSVHWYMR